MWTRGKKKCPASKQAGSMNRNLKRRRMGDREVWGKLAAYWEIWETLGRIGWGPNTEDRESISVMGN